MSEKTGPAHFLRAPDLDLSKLTAEELGQLRDEIIARAKKTLDPNSTGVEAFMMATDDGGIFPTDDGEIFPTDDGGIFPTEDVGWRDWWGWIERIVDVGATRIGLAVIAAGGSIAASRMFASEAGSRYASLTLGVSAVFGLWFVASAALAALRRR